MHNMLEYCIFYDEPHSKPSSPHSAKVPASYPCVIGCGELTAVVVGAPLARGELQLTFALQRGSAGDLQQHRKPLH